jgi:hypothetical protein
VSFQQASLPAFVAMKNGSFQFAVIASCGNAVRATPAQAPAVGVSRAQAVSRPQPAPRQQQQQQQSQQVSVNNSSSQTVQTTAQQPQPATTTAATHTQPVAEQPGKLVNTGPVGTAGAFLIATALGAVGYRHFILRRLANSC